MGKKKLRTDTDFVDQVLHQVYPSIHILKYSDVPRCNIISPSTISYWTCNAENGYVPEHASRWLLSIHAMKYSEVEMVEGAYRYGYARWRGIGMTQKQTEKILERVRPMKRMEQYGWNKGIDMLETAIYRLVEQRSQADVGSGIGQQQAIA